MASMHFTEQQSIPSFWRLLIFGGVTLMMGFVAFMVFQTEWSSMPPDEKPLLLTLLLGPIGTLMVFILRLDIRITPGTIEYKVYPFRKKFKVIPMRDITEIRLFKPVGFKSMQGIGTHKSINRTELNFGGKYQLIVSLRKGSMISFSTNKPQELKSFLLALPEGGPLVKFEV